MVAEDTPVRGPRRFVTFLSSRAPFRNHLTYLRTYLLIKGTCNNLTAYAYTVANITIYVMYDSFSCWPIISV